MAPIVSYLEVYDINRESRTVLQTFPRRIEAPNWTPDGKTLLYNSGGGIFSFDLQSRQSTKIYTGRCTACNNDHVLSPDGKQLAISAGTCRQPLSRIWILPITGGEPRLVTPAGNSFLHGWSPDAQRLAYCARRGGEFDVYTIAAGGGQETRLTDAPGLDDGPEYAPHGQTIWFNSVRTGRMQIWKMDANGANQTQVTFDEDCNSWFPHISPDGHHVVYLAYRAQDVRPGSHPPGKQVELRLLDLQSGKMQTVCRLYGGQGTINVNSWAPDSKRFAFVSYRPPARKSSRT